MASFSDLISPAGDPAPWRSAATAWRQLGAQLQAVGGALDPSVAALRGPAFSGEAADALTELWQGKLGTELQGDALAKYHSVADYLDKTAEQIEEFNQLAHALELSVAVGTVFSIVTAGAGLVLGVAKTAAAAAEVALAESALEAFFILLRSAMAMSLQYWAVGTGFGVTANALGIAIFDPSHNPFDMSKWSVRGIAESVNAGLFLGLMGPLELLAPVAEFAGAHAVAWNLGGGIYSAVPTNFLNLMGLEHQSFSEAWWKIGLFAGVWGGWNVTLGKALAPRVLGELPLPSPLKPSDWTPTESGLLVPALPKGFTRTDSGDVIPKPPNLFRRQPTIWQSIELGFIPGTPLRAVVPLPPQQVAATGPPPLGGQAPGPGLASPLATEPVPQPSPLTVSGSPYTVAPGDSLWDIAGRHYGDFTKFTEIAAANGIGPPYTLRPRQVLWIPDPALPAPP
jgi:hypothetical protein